MLRKHIPAGGGLGGGSADAAAALLAVRELLDVDVDDAGVLALAAEVGSDVPFFAGGFPVALVSGRGEHVKPLRTPSDPLFAVPLVRSASTLAGRSMNEAVSPSALVVSGFPFEPPFSLSLPGPPSRKSSAGRSHTFFCYI